MLQISANAVHRKNPVRLTRIPKLRQGAKAAFRRRRHRRIAGRQESPLSAAIAFSAPAARGLFSIPFFPFIVLPFGLFYIAAIAAAAGQFFSERRRVYRIAICGDFQEPRRAIASIPVLRSARYCAPPILEPCGEHLPSVRRAKMRCTPFGESFAPVILPPFLIPQNSGAALSVIPAAADIAIHSDIAFAVCAPNKSGLRSPPSMVFARAADKYAAPSSAIKKSRAANGDDFGSAQQRVERNTQQRNIAQGDCAVFFRRRIRRCNGDHVRRKWCRMLLLRYAGFRV